MRLTSNLDGSLPTTNLSWVDKDASSGTPNLFSKALTAMVTRSSKRCGLCSMSDGIVSVVVGVGFDVVVGEDVEISK